jgi:hypothetical protein
MLYVTQGTIRYDLHSIPPAEFPVSSIEATVNDDCGLQNCIGLTAYYQGEPIWTVYNTVGMGQETLTIPPPPEGVPYYDSFDLFTTGAFSFDHWWIIIIDP